MRSSQADSQLPSDVHNFGLTVQKSTASPLLLFALYSPNGTYDNVFLANYAYINVNDQMTRGQGHRQRHRRRRRPVRYAHLGAPGPAGQAGHHHPRHHLSGQRPKRGEPRQPGGGRAGAVPKGQEFIYAVRAQGRLQTEEEFNRIMLRANPDGSLVRLGEVARLTLDAQIPTTARLASTASLAVKMPGSSPLDAAQGAKKLMAELAQQLSAGHGVHRGPGHHPAGDRGPQGESRRPLIEALVLVILVVFVFLQGWRAALIPLLAVPVSLVGTLAVFPLFGFYINILSLFGLVVEAVEHHIEQGLTLKEATLKAMEDISGPVIAIAVILAAVFIPTAFIPGITGRLY